MITSIASAQVELLGIGGPPRRISVGRRPGATPSQKAVLSAGHTGAQNEEDAKYKVVPVGVLPGKTSTYLSEYHSINSLGHATGFSFLYTGSPYDQNLRSQAFIWQEGKLTALPLLSGWYGAWGWAINDRDQVAGSAWSIDANGFVRSVAVTWDHGQVKNLGTLGPASDWNSFAYGINDWGVVAGCSGQMSAPGSQPTLWQGGAIHALPFLPGMAYGCAESINDFGVITGRQHPPDFSSEVPCLWYWNGNGYTAVSIGNLGGDLGDALGINNLSQIVGWTFYAGDLHGPGFLWDHIHGEQALPTLPGDTDGQANQINDLGQITGFSWLYDNNGNQLSQSIVTWINGTPIDLQSMVPAGAPTFTDVGGVNLFGQIAIDSGSTDDGTSAGYVLIPKGD